MRKLISNKPAAKIQRKHTWAEIEVGIIILDKADPKEYKRLSWHKLVEEIGEFIVEPSMAEFKDIGHAIKAIWDFPNSVYSEGWILRNNRGHQQEKE